MLLRAAILLCRRSSPSGAAGVGAAEAKGLCVSAAPPLRGSETDLLPMPPSSDLAGSGSPGADAALTERAQAARRFYEMVASSTTLTPTKLGYGGSEHVLNNTELHRNPWQASCIELRERTSGPLSRQYHVLSYGHIDFASLPRHNPNDKRGRVVAATEAEAGNAPPPPPELEVVHYFETSSPAGLAGYQAVAQTVRRGQLPGRVENYTAAFGYGIWIVPRSDYVNLLVEKHLLEV